MSEVIREPSLSFSDVLIVPQHTRLESRKDADLSTDLFDEVPIMVPIISANMPAVTGATMATCLWWTGGMGALHRFNSIDDAVNDYVTCRNIGANAIVSLGIHEGLERALALADQGATMFLVDVAHGDSQPVFEFVQLFRKTMDARARLMVGNVATAQAVSALEDLGVDAIKVGVGPGAACTTRQVTGAGRGQLTAVMDCASVARVPIVADGGISTSGDIVKAIGAGASTVMLGRLLAGCDESPEPGSYWGNASHRQNGHRAPEGVAGEVPRTGDIETTLKPLLWGLRSGISYAGAISVRELRGNAVFERIASGVVQESAARV